MAANFQDGCRRRDKNHILCISGPNHAILMRVVSISWFGGMLNWLRTFVSLYDIKMAANFQDGRHRGPQNILSCVANMQLWLDWCQFHGFGWWWIDWEHGNAFKIPKWLSIFQDGCNRSHKNYKSCISGPLVMWFWWDWCHLVGFWRCCINLE